MKLGILFPAALEAHYGERRVGTPCVDDEREWESLVPRERPDCLKSSE
ncbi:MAG: hypothetical protein WCI12_06405 [Actinomycetes bacterium]